MLRVMHKRNSGGS